VHLSLKIIYKWWRTGVAAASI